MEEKNRRTETISLVCAVAVMQTHFLNVFLCISHKNVTTIKSHFLFFNLFSQSFEN